MSTNYYECKVKYRKVNELGVQKVVTEIYLVDAVSYTEAEQRINQKMAEYISVEFKVTNIKSANFTEVHDFNDSNLWFKSKITLIAYDEESGKERKQNIYLLIQANNAKEAYENTCQVMQNSLGDYTVPSVSETKILDFFPYN